MISNDQYTREPLVTLRINEIYRSIQGESTWAGIPCTFVRTMACDIRCDWCDTEYAFYKGVPMEVEDIVQHVTNLGMDLVELTGGEPLLQKELPLLSTRLMEKGATVLVETGGHHDISVLPPGVIRIMDLKCPGSGMIHRNRLANIEHLKPQDEVKFVIKDFDDFLWARDVTVQYRLEERVKSVLFSPVFGQCTGEELVGWLLESGLRARFQLQLHKYVWSPTRTGV